jgi:hypothetical protein
MRFFRFLYPKVRPVGPIECSKFKAVNEIINGERIFVNQDARDAIAWMQVRIDYLNRRENELFYYEHLHERTRDEG